MSRLTFVCKRYTDCAVQTDYESSLMSPIENDMPSPCSMDNQCKANAGTTHKPPKQLLYPAIQRPFNPSPRSVNGDFRVISLPETLPLYSVKSSLEAAGALRIPSVSGSSKPHMTSRLDSDKYQYLHNSPPHASDLGSVSVDASSFTSESDGEGYLRAPSSTRAFTSLRILPDTPSPSSSAADSVDIISHNEVCFPDAFLRSQKQEPRRAPKDDSGWMNWANSPPRPIPALHGPCSLPYARCPSGAEGIIFEEPGEVPRAIWGLDPSSSQHHSPTNPNQHSQPQSKASHLGSRQTNSPSYATSRQHQLPQMADYIQPFRHNRSISKRSVVSYRDSTPKDYWQNRPSDPTFDTALNLDQMITLHLEGQLNLNPYRAAGGVHSDIHGAFLLAQSSAPLNGAQQFTDPASPCSLLPLGKASLPNQRTAFEIAKEHRGNFSGHANSSTVSSPSPILALMSSDYDFCHTRGSPECLLSQPSSTPILAPQSAYCPDKICQSLLQPPADLGQESRKPLCEGKIGLHIHSIGSHLAATDITPAEDLKNMSLSQIPPARLGRLPVDYWNSSSKLSVSKPSPKAPLPPRPDCLGFHRKIIPARAAPTFPMTPLSPKPDLRLSTPAQPDHDPLSPPFFRKKSTALAAVPEEAAISTLQHHHSRHHRTFTLENPFVASSMASQSVNSTPGIFSDRGEALSIDSAVKSHPHNHSANQADTTQHFRRTPGHRLGGWNMAPDDAEKPQIKLKSLAKRTCRVKMGKTGHTASA